MKVKVTQSGPTLWDPMDYIVHGILQARILEWVAFLFSRGSSQAQGLDSGLPHCRWILYQLSHQGSPRILEWGASPFSSGSSWPRNQTRVSWIAGRFFISWVTREAITHEPIFMSSFIGTQPHSFAYILSMAAFSPQHQSWVIGVETTWPTKPQTFTILPFTEKVFQSLWKGLFPLLQLVWEKKSIKIKFSLWPYSSQQPLDLGWHSHHVLQMRKLRYRGVKWHSQQVPKPRPKPGQAGFIRLASSYWVG